MDPQRLTVDALGELTGVDGEPVARDTAAGVPTLAQVGEVSVTGCGPLTGLLPEPSSAGSGLGEWITRAWRPGSTGADPWDVAPGAEPGGLPAGRSVGGQGNLLVGGLEWMQTRRYDPGSRGSYAGR